jgi:3-oxoadipate enol-lactonase
VSIPSKGRNTIVSTSDGVALAVTHWSAPFSGAPRLALAHSLALDRHVWDAVVERLRTTTEILTYDCRGHGESERREGRFTAELFARDLAELLDEIGWDTTAVAGCSMGGCVALAFAGLHPARVTHLGLIDTTAWYGNGAALRFAERAAEARTKGMSGLVDFQTTRWFSDAYRANRPREMEQALATFLANDLECYASTCALLGAVDLRAVLPGLSMPAAVIVGEEDYATPVAMSRALHDALPRSTLTVLPRARHLTPVENPDEIARELASLLART